MATIDLTSDDIDLTSDVERWTCPNCTYNNPPGVKRCICLQESPTEQQNQLRLIQQINAQEVKEAEAASLKLVEQLVSQQQHPKEAEAASLKLIEQLVSQQHHHQQQQQQQQLHSQQLPDNLIAAALQAQFNNQMNPALLQRLRDRRFWKGRILNNRLRENNVTDVSLVDIVEPVGLQRALVSSFSFGENGIHGIFGACLEGKYDSNFKLVLVDNYDRTKQNCGAQLEGERMIRVFPYFQTNTTNGQFGKYGLQHTKLMLLQYQDRLRIVISSENFASASSISTVSQSFFVADLRLNSYQSAFEGGSGKSGSSVSTSTSTSSSSSSSSKNYFADNDVADDLNDLLHRWEPHGESIQKSQIVLAQRAFQPWYNVFEGLDASTKFNFEPINQRFAIVASVPRFQTTIPTLATLENSNERLYGIARLSQLVRKVKATVLEERQRNGNSDSLILDVDFAFSSMGTLDAFFWNSLTEATTGHVLSLKSSKSKKKWEEEHESGKVRLVFPTISQVLGNEDIHGLGSLNMPRKTLNDKVLKRRLDVPDGREGHLLHAKIMIGNERTTCSSTSSNSNGGNGGNGVNDTKKQRRWILTGSHNCSRNAWGSVTSKPTRENGKPQHSMTSYELGVFVFGRDVLEEADIPIISPAPEFQDPPAKNQIETPLGRIIAPQFQPELFSTEVLYHYLSQSNVVRKMVPYLSGKYVAPISNANASDLSSSSSSSSSSQKQPKRGICAVLFYSPSSEQDNDSLNNDAATAVQYGNLGRTLEGVCASVELINLDEDGHSGIAVWDHLYQFRHSPERDHGAQGYTSPPYLIVYTSHKFIKPSLNSALKRMDAVCGENLGLHGKSLSMRALCTQQSPNHMQELNGLRMKLEILRTVFEENQKETKQREIRKLQQANDYLMNCLSKKVLIFTIWEGLIKFSKGQKNMSSFKSLLPGRITFFKQLSKMAHILNKEMPKIIIIGNSGGVGLRRSMQIGKWPKGKPTAYLTLPTREESESKWKAVIHRLEEATRIEIGGGRTKCAVVEWYASYRHQNKEKSRKYASKNPKKTDTKSSNNQKSSSSSSSSSNNTFNDNSNTSSSSSSLSSCDPRKLEQLEAHASSCNDCKELFEYASVVTVEATALRMTNKTKEERQHIHQQCDKFCPELSHRSIKEQGQPGQEEKKTMVIVRGRPSSSSIDTSPEERAWHPSDKTIENHKKEFQGNEWLKNWRLPNQGMIWAALGTGVHPNEALWVGHSLKEDKGCAKKITGLDFYFAIDFFNIWEQQEGSELGTESALDVQVVNNVEEIIDISDDDDDEDVVMKDDNKETSEEDDDSKKGTKRSSEDKKENQTQKKGKWDSLGF